MTAILDPGRALDRVAALHHRPAQFEVLRAIASHLTASPAVTHLLVRGSLAHGGSDRLSDMDLVVGVREDLYAEFVAAHHALVATAMGGVLPGWPDTIVPRMGGLGFVHLVEQRGKLHQLDLYLTPSTTVDHVRGVTTGELIYTARIDPADPGALTAARAFVDDQLARPATVQELIVETLVLAWMLRKRITRRQTFMAYGEAHALTLAARDLCRAVLTPARVGYNWYHLDDDLGRTPLGRTCLEALAALTETPPVPSAASLRSSLITILGLARRLAPEVTDPMELAIEAVLRHIDG